MRNIGGGLRENPIDPFPSPGTASMTIGINDARTPLGFSPVGEREDTSPGHTPEWHLIQSLNSELGFKPCSFELQRWLTFQGGHENLDAVMAACDRTQSQGAPTEKKALLFTLAQYCINSTLLRTEREGYSVDVGQLGAFIRRHATDKADLIQRCSLWPLSDLLPGMLSR